LPAFGCIGEKLGCVGRLSFGFGELDSAGREGVTGQRRRCLEAVDKPAGLELSLGFGGRIRLEDPALGFDDLT
jgi:hypothetical protein